MKEIFKEEQDAWEFWGKLKGYGDPVAAVCKDKIRITDETKKSLVGNFGIGKK